MVVKGTGSVNLGQLERTPRAFWQDAWTAMRGSIVRAIVEYVTNSDDSYARLGKKGRILVEVEHRRGDEPWYARVRDRAEGMTLQEMRERIGKQGVRTSGFETGLAVRGNLGLGSKDPACFGKVPFESIKDGTYAWFAIDEQGEVTAVPRPIKATKEIREELSIPQNGTVVTIEVRHHVSCPRHETLKQILQNHVFLRDIMQDPDREVLLLHANKPGEEPKRLRHVPPDVNVRVNKKRIELPGYKGAKADILIAEAEEPFLDEGPRSPTRKSGLLIKGRRAIYESTLFGLESTPYAHAFTGYVKCEDIDRIASEYDERAEKRLPHPIDNPRPIISRQRDGLAEDHPLYQAILRLAEEELAPLVTERERRVRERARLVESEQTTKLLSQLSRAATKFMDEVADEEEVTLELAEDGQKPTPALAIVPPAVEMPFSSERIVSVLAAKSGLDGDKADVTLSFAPPGLVGTPSYTVRLRPSRRREDVLSTTVKLVAGPALGATLLEARLGLRQADCVIEVVEPTAPPEPEPPRGFEFERARYRLVVGKPKVIKIRAPLGAYPESTVVRVASNHPKVVVLEGGRTQLQSRPEKLAMEGNIRVEGRVENVKARLTATDPAHRVAAVDVEVVRREESGFKIELVPEVQGDQRAQWSQDYGTLRIMGEHPGVKPYLGDKDDNHPYPGQNTPEFKALLAELVADAVARRILLKKFQDDETDVGTLYVYHYRFMGRFLARAHRVLRLTVS